MLNIVPRGFQFTFQAIQNVRNSKLVCQVIDLINFNLGFVGIHYLVNVHYFEDKEVKALYQELPSWQQRAFKITDLLGNLSLVLGGVNSQPAIAICKWSIQKILSPEKLEQLLNHQGYLPGEKLYRMIGLLAFVMGIPTTLRTFYFFYTWINCIHRKAFKEQDKHFYTPVPIRRTDVAITVKTTVKTVSEAARQIIVSSPHKKF